MLFKSEENVACGPYFVQTNKEALSLMHIEFRILQLGHVNGWFLEPIERMLTRN